RSEHRARVPAAREFGEIAAVAAADVGDGFVAVEPGELERLAGQVYPRLLVGVDGLPRGQVDVRLVLGFSQVGLVRPRVPGRVGTGHPVIRSSAGRSAGDLVGPQLAADADRVRCLAAGP